LDTLDYLDYYAEQRLKSLGLLDDSAFTHPFPGTIVCVANAPMARRVFSPARDRFARCFICISSIFCESRRFAPRSAKTCLLNAFECSRIFSLLLLNDTDGERPTFEGMLDSVIA
jgi:hypothetical protein